MRRLYIWLLKWRLRGLLNRFYKMRSNYDCSTDIFFQVSPYGYSLAMRIDAILDQLATLDPECPIRKLTR